MTPIPTTRHLLVALAYAALALALVACGRADPPELSEARHPAEQWSRAEVLDTLDLSELGEITVDREGVFLLGGKRLPPDLPSWLSYGRELNLLRLDDAVLDAMPPTTRDVLLHAGPRALRAHLDEIGLSMGQVRAAWARTQGHAIGRADLRRALGDRAADPALARALGLEGGP